MDILSITSALVVLTDAVRAGRSARSAETGMPGPPGDLLYHDTRFGHDR